MRTSLEHQAAVNAFAKVSQNKSNANAKAAGKTLGEIAAKLKTANKAAANGSNAKAATAIGAAVTAAKTASKKGWFSKLGNVAKNFTRGVGARLGKLRNMFKGAQVNAPTTVAKPPMFTGSFVTNPGDYKQKGPNSLAGFISRMGTKAASARGRLSQHGSFSAATRKENKAIGSLRNAQVLTRAGLLAKMPPNSRQRVGRFQEF